MATTKIWAIKGAINAVINYSINPDKTIDKTSALKVTIKDTDGSSVEFYEPDVETIMKQIISADLQGERRYTTYLNCTEKNVLSEMLLTKQRFGKTGGNMAYHAYQSFAHGEVTPEIAHEIGVNLAKEMWGDRFEVIVSTHLDTSCIHNHFVLNSVSFIDGKKYYDNKDTYHKMRHVSDRLCKEYGLSVLPESGGEKGRHRGAIRAEAEGRYSLESIVKEDIDSCILFSRTLKEFFEMMSAKGYRIDTQRKYVRVYPYGHKNPIRIDRRFGSEYSISGITERIKDHGGKDRQTPKKPDLSRYSGIQVIYIRYLYLLGVYPRKSPAQIARTHFLLREDLLKFDTYIGESQYLIKNNIKTEFELLNAKTEETEVLSALCKERNKIRNRLRRCAEGDRVILTEELADINKTIKEQKKNVFYCNDIKRSLDQMKEKLQTVDAMQEQEKGVEQEDEQWSE